MTLNGEKRLYIFFLLTIVGPCTLCLNFEAQFSSRNCSWPARNTMETVLSLSVLSTHHSKSIPCFLLLNFLQSWNDLSRDIFHFQEFYL